MRPFAPCCTCNQLLEHSYSRNRRHYYRRFYDRYGTAQDAPRYGADHLPNPCALLTEETLEPLAVGLARLLTALGAPQAKVGRIDHPLSADAAKRIEGAEGFSLLFNATNFGRAPDTDQMPIESADVFQCFPKLKAVLDSVDEPVRPRLIWEAQQRGLEARTTLGLRVVVAREAMELFAGRTLPLCATRSILCDIRREASNIVLIGMPGCGKTTIGKCVAARLLRPFIDLDALVERRVGKSSERIYREDGEEYFRGFESEIIKELSGRHGLVISTGGGACLRPETVCGSRSTARSTGSRGRLTTSPPISGRSLKLAA